jgi:nucleoside 2-deoxyribosyltransferase
MNIYFACSITGGRKDETKYQLIVDTLLKDGHTIPTAHLSQQDVAELESIVAPEEVYLRDTSWIDACDALIAEISTPSHGVGYEIAYALNQGKQVLCIFKRGKPISKMLSGNTHPNICVKPYLNTKDMIQIIQSFLEELLKTDN